MARTCKLDAELVDRIVDAVRKGAHRDIAARVANVSAATIYRWLQEGRNAIERGENGLKREFYEAVKKAEAEWEQEQVVAIEEIAQGGQLLSRTITTRKNGDVVTQETYSRPEWTARAWLLERKAADRWAKRERVEHGGPDGGPIPIHIVDMVVKDGNGDT